MEICDEFNTNFDRHIGCFIEHFEQGGVTINGTKSYAKELLFSEISKYR